MAITYPTTIDELTNPASGDGLNSPSHSDQHINANDILEALEAKVGIDSSAVATSHDYKIDALESGKADTDQTMYIGTTAVDIDRGSATLNLAGIGTLGCGAITATTIKLTTGASLNKVLTSDADGNATWEDASGGASQLSELSDVVSATNTNRFALMANGSTGYVGRALVEADISDLGTYAATNQTFYIGTTQVAINRGSATLNLAGIGTLGCGAITSSNTLRLTTGNGIELPNNNPLSWNNYYDGGWKYRANGYGGRIIQDASGNINIATSISGTAGDAVSLITALSVSSLQIVSSRNLYPQTDNTYYLGKNDDDTPFAWKGVILKDTTNSKYYRVEVINGTITATDLTD